MDSRSDSTQKRSNTHMAIAEAVIAKLNSKGTQIMPRGLSHGSYWFVFSDHRWSTVPPDYVFKHMTADISEAISQTYSDHSDTKIARMAYRREICKCVARILYKKEVIDNMDTNMNLIGFNNGVFELDSRKFRPGKPEDYISITTGYDYVPISPNDPAYLKTMTFLTELLPDPVVRDKWLELLASCLSGNRDVFRPNEFNVMIGTGANGKSTMMRLVMLAFGEYCGMIWASQIRSNTTRWDKLRLVFINEDEYQQEKSLANPEVDPWNNFNCENIIHRVVTGKSVFYRELYQESLEVIGRSKIIYCGRMRLNLKQELLNTEYNFTADFSSAGRQIDTDSMKHAFMTILLNYRYAKYAKIIQCVWRKARDNPYCTVGQNCINHGYDSLIGKQ